MQFATKLEESHQLKKDENGLPPNISEKLGGFNFDLVKR